MAKEPKETKEPARSTTRTVRLPITIVTKDKDGKHVEHQAGQAVTLPTAEADALVARFGIVEPAKVET